MHRLSHLLYHHDSGCCIVDWYCFLGERLGNPRLYWAAQLVLLPLVSAHCYLMSGPPQQSLTKPNPSNWTCVWIGRVRIGRYRGHWSWTNGPSSAVSHFINNPIAFEPCPCAMVRNTITGGSSVVTVAPFDAGSVTVAPFDAVVTNAIPVRLVFSLDVRMPCRNKYINHYFSS